MGSFQIRTSLIRSGCVLPFCIVPCLFSAQITRIAPPLGQPGDVVTISGSGFSTFPSDNVVRFGPNRAPVLAVTSAQLTVQVPNGQPLGITIVKVSGSNGQNFSTVAKSKIPLPPNPGLGGPPGPEYPPPPPPPPPPPYTGYTGVRGSKGDDCGCESSPAVNLGGFSGETTNSGNIYSELGDFSQFATDLSIPGVPGANGMVQFSFQRQYRAQLSTDGPLGHNWNHSYFERLNVQIDGSIVDVNGLGRNDRYLLNNMGNFVAPPEFYTTLVRNPNGTFTLRYRRGTTKTFDTDGKLLEIRDRNNNFMSFFYNGQGQLVRVNDSLGRDILYVYVTSGPNTGRLMEIDDFNGRKVTFTYDANGDLVAVTSPVVNGTPNGNDFPQGKTTRYTYSSGFSDDRLNHNLLTVTRPNEAGGGSAVVTNVYGTDQTSFSFDKVVQQTYGGTNASGIPAGGQFTFSYTQLNAGVNSDDPNLPASRVLETDRNGNVKQFDFNRVGYPVALREFTRGLRPTDPPFYLTAMLYNADGRLLQTTLPSGNQIVYTYDEGNPDRLERGNLLQYERLPDARGGDQTALVTTYTYEPRFNQVKTVTDPRGNDPTFIPPNGGINAPGRYTTTYTFDYEINPAATGGNIVRKQEPTVTLVDGTQQQIITDYTYNAYGEVTSMTDPEGNVTQYLYFPQTDPDGDGIPDGTRPGLDTATGGYLKQKIIDATTSPRRTETAPPVALSTGFVYDPVGNVIRKIDPRGNDTLFTVNSLNQVVRLQTEAPYRYIRDTFYDANNNEVRRDIENRVASTQDGKPVFSGGGNFNTVPGSPTFFQHRYTYDILDRLVQSDEDATGSTPSRLITNYRYDGNENRTQEIFPEGNVFATAYDERDLRLTVTRGLGTPQASTFAYSYDQNRNLVLMLDGRSNPTTYQFDGFDRHVGSIDAVGNQMTRNYDPNNNMVKGSSFGTVGGPGPNVLLRQTGLRPDELNRVYQYDDLLFVAAGVVTVRPPVIVAGPLNPGNVSERFIFDRNSRVVQEIEDDLATVTTQYDGVNRLVLVTDPQGNTRRYAYDANSNIIQTVDTELSQKSGVTNETFTTTYQYDSRNGQTSASDNCGNTRRAAYDSRDNLTDATDARFDNTAGCPGAQNDQGNSTRYTYDGMSRPLQTIQDLRTGGLGSGPVAGQITTTLAYDGNRRLTSLTDSNGNKTRYSYDALDRRMTETLADSTGTSYSYDANDNVVQVTDNNGTVQAHTYDAINRRTQTNVTPAAGVIGTTANTYQYDGLSRVTQMTDNNNPSDATSASIVTLAYDSLGRVVEESQNGRAVDGAWFAQARRTGLTYPNNRQLNYTYDSLERIQTIQDAGAATNIGQYTYMGPQRVLQRQYQNGTRLTYLDDTGATDIGYDGVRRTVTRRDLRSDNSLVVGFAHAYDRENNKNGEDKLHILANSESYGYDSAYRTVNFQRGQQAPTKTEQWTLDGVGNWLVDTVNGLPETRTVNNTNEYTTRNLGSLTYDNNGNLTSGSGLGYQWDYKNRLRQACFLPSNATSCTAPGAVVLATYNYDAMNRRTRKVVINSGSLNGTTNFYYDGWRTIEERDGSDVLTQQYVYGIYTDEPIVLDRAGGQRLFYHQNTMSSTFALTDASGNTVEGYQYDAYGQQTVFKPDFVTAIGPLSAYGNPYMFTGQRFDPETGLLYYKNRYYSAALGRFLSRDPVGYWDSLNLYEYVESAPTYWLDPIGLYRLTITIAFVDAGDFTENTAAVWHQAGSLSHNTWDWARKSGPVSKTDKATTLVGAIMKIKAAGEWYSPSGYPKDCIEKLIFAGHGSEGEWGLSASRVLDGTDLKNPASVASGLFSQLKNLFCSENEGIELQMCHQAQGAAGKSLMINLANITGAKVKGWTGAYDAMGTGHEVTANPGGTTTSVKTGAIKKLVRSVMRTAGGD